MKRKMLILLILIGITFYFDVDDQVGVGWINNSTTNATIIVHPSMNIVTWYGSDGTVDKMTWDQFRKEYGEKMLAKEGKFTFVIMKQIKEAPKILY